MIRTDEELKKGVVDHLFWDNSIDASGIKVEVFKRKAILTGSVVSFNSKIAAAAVTWLVPGIKDVENHLSVQFPAGVTSLTDDNIQQNAKQILSSNSDVHDLAISISAKQGVVTLDGTVATYWQRNKAEKLVSDLRGVLDVINNINVVPTRLLDDHQITENIEAALENSPLVNEDKIAISVTDGKVTLAGSTTSWHNRLQVYSLVANCRGVIDIQNNINVE